MNSNHPHPVLWRKSRYRIAKYRRLLPTVLAHAPSIGRGFIFPIRLWPFRMVRFRVQMDSYFTRAETIAACPVNLWNHGEMQALSLAKVWSGRARLPNVERLWKEYHPVSQDDSFINQLGQDTTLAPLRHIKPPILCDRNGSSICRMAE